MKLSYTINELREATGLGRTFLYQKIASGDLVSVKAGSRTYHRGFRRSVLRLSHARAGGEVMSGLGLSDLPRPLDEFNPALDLRFEDRSEVQALDRATSRALVRANDLPGIPFDPEEARRLAFILDYESRGEGPPASRACRLYIGDERMRVGGANCCLIHKAQDRGEQVSFVTLCPRDGDVRPEDLADFNRRPFGDRLDSALNRITTEKALGGRGWSILYLDCEFQEVESIFRFHWHGWATGSGARGNRSASRDAG